MGIRARTKIVKGQRHLQIDPEGCKDAARTVEPVEEEEEKKKKKKKRKRRRKKENRKLKKRNLYL